MAQAPSAGELRIVFPSLWNEGLDPILTSSSGSIGIAAIYDDLIGTKADGSDFSKETGLAGDWSMAPDGKSWTIRIRSGVQFHNGYGEVTAEDVKFSIDRLTSERSVAQRKGHFRERVGPVEIVDRYTVRVPAKAAPIPDLLSDLSALQGSTERFIVSRKAAEEMGPDKFAINPVGSGPYRFIERVGGQYIRLASAGKHWRIQPRFEGVRFMAVPEEETSIAMLGRGEADVAPIGRNNIERVKKQRGGDVVLQKSSASLVVYFDDQFVERVPVNKAKVREALNLAIDRKTIAETLFEGYARPFGTYYTQSVIAESVGHDWKGDLYPFDPVKARQLLAEAGYPNGFDIDVWIYPWIGVPEGPDMMHAIAGMWEKIGVRPQVQQTEYGVVRAKLLKGEMPGAVGYFVAPARPWQGIPGIYRVFMHSKGSFSHVQQPELDTLLDTAATALDASAAKTSIAEAMRRIRAGHLAAPIVELDQAYGVTAKAKHWDPGFRPQNLNFDSLLAR
ncbi:ABC transporter substrate-binding protein [Stella sp.]|uniref:ABC transporter substrate-binding protein n=1 Tax=Stella sp. TaxID=2912054 RepID=UPI0035B0392C